MGGPWWNGGAPPKNHAFPKSCFDRMGLGFVDGYSSTLPVRFMNRRMPNGTSSWCGRTAGVIPPPTRFVSPLSSGCSSEQRFAYSFLQIPPRDGHPCRSANTFPCRVCRGLTPPSECGLPGAPTKRRPVIPAALAAEQRDALVDRS